MKACYAKAYGNLRVTSLTLEQRLETCGYWYTITTDDSMAHTAFATERGLLRWLDERGLSGADVNARAGNGWSALRYADNHQHTHIADLLREARAQRATQEAKPLETATPGAPRA